MKKLGYYAGWVVGSILGMGYLPYPGNAICMAIVFGIIILGIIVEIVRACRRTSDRFWNALENPNSPRNPDPTAESDYIPYVTTKYRRLK